MSDGSRLPAHPSLEQLRKQAKDRLRAMRATEPSSTLADAQYAVARDHGFESWPKLVHHIDVLAASGRVERFERLAGDILAGYHGDVPALERLIVAFGVNYSPEQWRIRVRSRVDDARGTSDGAPTLDDVRRMVAAEYGSADWPAFVQALATKPAEAASLHGATPPFYRLDLERNRIEPRPPLSDADWDAILDVMRERRITAISTPALTDRAMAKLARLDFVTAIHAGGAQGLTDEGVLQIARMPQLEELELGGWHCPVTDRGLEVLRHLARLRRFEVGWAQRITDAGAVNLTFCERLERVNLTGTPTGDGTLNALRGREQLGDLHTGRQVTDAGLALLHDFPVFKTWRGAQVHYDLMAFSPSGNNLLLDGPITDRGLERLAGLDGLFGLGFFQHARAFTGAGLSALAPLSHLGFLGVPGDLCDDDAMRAIAAFPNLRMLMAQGTIATDGGFEALSHSPTLEYLWGRECPNLRGRGFAALAALPSLRGLGVSCRHVDDAALSALPRFASLRQLMPMDVPDAGFRHVGACERLDHLWCMYCRNTGDEATGHIAGLKLTSYYAGKTKITDRSLEILGRMTTLEKLEFWETAGITDAGMAALARLPRLRALSIAGVPRVTRAGVSLFPPSVRIDLGA
jgi:hypothetical protein